MIRFYGADGALRDLVHVDEELAVHFLHRKHNATRVFLAAIEDDLRHGREVRALGHVA